MGNYETCAHGISLELDCDHCIESYGSNRLRPGEKMSVATRTNELKWGMDGKLMQRWVMNGGSGESIWREVPGRR